MKETFKSLILEFHEKNLPKLTLRSLEISVFPSEVRKAHILMGMRRTGNAWILFRQVNRLVEQGLDKRKILYLNFEEKYPHYPAVCDPNYLISHDLRYFRAIESEFTNQVSALTMDKINES